eukprot:6184600-Pleurochrysis_carterae.AAC.4
MKFQQPLSVGNDLGLAIIHSSRCVRRAWESALRLSSCCACASSVTYDAAVFDCVAAHPFPRVGGWSESATTTPRARASERGAIKGVKDRESETGRKEEHERARARERLVQGASPSARLFLHIFGAAKHPQPRNSQSTPSATRNPPSATRNPRPLKLHVASTALPQLTRLFTSTTAWDYSRAPIIQMCSNERAALNVPMSSGPNAQHALLRLAAVPLAETRPRRAPHARIVPMRALHSLVRVLSPVSKARLGFVGIVTLACVLSRRSNVSAAWSARSAQI